MISLNAIVMFIVYLLVAGAIFYLLNYLVDAVPAPDPFKRVAKLALLVFAVLFLINLLLGLVGHPIVSIGP